MKSVLLEAADRVRDLSNAQPSSKDAVAERMHMERTTRCCAAPGETRTRPQLHDGYV